MNARREKTVRAHLEASGKLPGPLEISFLAAGEYNENYLVEGAFGRRVLRVNRGSQLGLEDQIGYEFRVLTAVFPSGATPRPYFYDPAPPGLPGGCLLMDFLPGGPLDYGRDLEAAGDVLARVHALPPDPGLLVQADPVGDVAAECLALIERFPDHPRRDVKRDLLDRHAQTLELAEKTRPLFRNDPLVMVNTELNSGNFLAGPEGVFLVDWEKAVVSSRFQDLGHFLCPTTTLWKTDVLLSEAEERAFLEAYRKALAGRGVPAPDPDELFEKTRILEKTILLRGVSWCFMAWYEYVLGRRPFANPGVLAVIERYLDNRQWFFAART